MSQYTKKPQLVILPGWGGNKKTWNEFLVLSRDILDVKLIELPCFGEEPCPTEIWGVEEYADFVVKKIRKNNINNFILLGHSFGGQVASYIAGNNMLNLDGLILSGAASIRPKKALKRFLSKIIAKVTKSFFYFVGLGRLFTVMRPLFYKLIGSPDYLATKGIKTEIYKKIIRQDQTELLSQIKTKTLVVWGKRDKHVSINLGKKIAGLIPDSDMIVYNGASHGLHRQVTQTLIKDIKKFADICLH